MAVSYSLLCWTKKLSALSCKETLYKFRLKRFIIFQYIILFHAVISFYLNLYIYVFIQPLCHGKDVTQNQILSEV